MKLHFFNNNFDVELFQTVLFMCWDRGFYLKPICNKDKTTKEITILSGYDDYMENIATGKTVTELYDSFLNYLKENGYT